jgi:hypothetical protein
MLAPERAVKFDHILKVDVGNKLQLGLIHENGCMEVISFWTDNFVYHTDPPIPIETCHQRLEPLLGESHPVLRHR